MKKYAEILKAITDKKRKFVGKKEISGITHDIVRRNLGWKVGCYYDASDDNYYDIQMMDYNTWFNPETLHEYEIPLYFSGNWSMADVVMKTKKHLIEKGFNPDYIGEEND